MRDLERKVNRFVKERANVQSAKKPTRVASPMMRSVISPSTAYSMSQSATKVTKTVNNRTFSMTVTFTPQVNPRFHNQKGKDISILHQDKKQQSVTMKPFDHARSPKRNPITQDGQEPCYEFKAPFKATPLTNKMTFYDEEVPIKKKGDGECKGVDTRSLSPPAPCIRTFHPRAIRESEEPEEPRRIRKGGAAQSLKNLVNPIVEGDLQSLNNRRVRKAAASPGPSEETKKFNDKGKLLATEIGYSPKGRVFRDTSLVDFAHPIEEVSEVKGRRHASPQYRNKSEMSGLLQYSHSGVFRQENVSPKVNSNSFYSMIKGMNTSHMF